MITVNLLPPELRPIKRTPIPYIITTAILAVVILLVGALFVQNTARIAGANAQLAKHKQERDELQPVIDEANELAKQKAALSEQVETIAEITRDRIIWSEQMYHLSRLALDNLWYHEIKVAKRTTTENRESFDPKKKKTVVKRVRINHQYLTVDGYVVPGEDGLAPISPFTVAAEQDEDFAQTFTMDPDIEFRDTDFDNNPVREFAIEFLVSPGGTK